MRQPKLLLFTALLSSLGISGCLVYRAQHTAGEHVISSSPQSVTANPNAQSATQSNNDKTQAAPAFFFSSKSGMPFDSLDKEPLIPGAVVNKDQTPKATTDKPAMLSTSKSLAPIDILKTLRPEEQEKPMPKSLEPKFHPISKPVPTFEIWPTNPLLEQAKSLPDSDKVQTIKKSE